MISFTFVSSCALARLSTAMAKKTFSSVSGQIVVKDWSTPLENVIGRMKICVDNSTKMNFGLFLNLVCFRGILKKIDSVMHRDVFVCDLFFFAPLTPEQFLSLNKI